MKIALLLTISVLGLTNLKAQTVDDVINKWVNAMGGSKQDEN